MTLTHRLGDSLQLGVLADVRTGPDYNLNLLTAIANSLEEGRVDIGNGLSESNLTSVQGAVAAAWGLHEMVGVFARAGYEHDFWSTGSEDSGSIIAGGGVSLDSRSLPRYRGDDLSEGTSSAIGL